MSLFTSKKGDGMSLNVVVVAALALIVLIVLTAIFATKMKDSNQKGDASTKNTMDNVCSRDGRYCNTSGVSCNVPGKNSIVSGSFIDCIGTCCS